MNPTEPAITEPGSLSRAQADAAPVTDGQRIAQLDALRGIALLGILIANVRQMFLPFDVAGFPVALGGSERLAWLDWQVYHALVDLKFITIFSLLFGVGFALQAARLEERGAPFRAIYLRRVGVLASFGAAHGLLLYSAEVLLPYAACGAVLLMLRGLQAATMLRIGLALLGVTLIWGYEIGALGHVSVAWTVLAVASLAGATFALRRTAWRWTVLACAVIVIAVSVGVTVDSRPHSSDESVGREYAVAMKSLAAMEAGDLANAPEEFRVRRQGSFGDLLALHASQYTQLLFFLAVFLLWRTLALFLIGAGLFRAGLPTRLAPRDWRRIAIFGLAVGFVLSALATALEQRDMLGRADLRWPAFLHAFSALPLAAGICACVIRLHDRAPRSVLWKRIDAAGRMALTNYIGQSLVMAALAESWGMGGYGRLTGPELTLLAVLVFAMLAAASYAWLGRYRMGPLEWVWRCATYGRRLPNRR